MSVEDFAAEDVVSDLFAAEDTSYDDSGNGWHHEVTGNGNVIEIAIAASDDDGFATGETRHFRAVVVEGAETPIVVAPEVLAAARVLYRAHVNEGSESTEQAAHTRYEVAAALYALTPDQVAVLAGDDEPAAQAEQNGGAA